MNSQDESQALFKNKRDQYVVEIRKKKNEEYILAKRMKFQSLVDLQNGNEQNTEMQTDIAEATRQLEELKYNFNSAVNSGDFQLLEGILEAIRRIVSFDDSPPIEALYNTNMIPTIISLMDHKKHNNDKITLEATWIIANTASSDMKFVEYIVDQGAIIRAISLLDHPSEDIKDNAVFILSNIAGDNPKYRDILIQRDIAPRLAKVLSALTYSPGFISHCLWLMSNICKKPYPEFYELAAFLDPLEKCLQIDNPEILHNVLWCFSYLTDGENAQIEEILMLGIQNRLVELLRHQDFEVLAPCLRTVGNLLTGEDDQTRKMLKAGVIAPLARLLEDNRMVIRKETAWAFSNILACSYEEIQDVLEFENMYIMKRLYDMATNDQYDVRKESLYAICNPCAGATLTQLQILIDSGIFNVLLDRIKENEDVKLVRCCVRAIDNILEAAEDTLGMAGNGDNPYLMKLVEAGGVPVIENLQEHPDQGIYKAVSSIIDNYFSKYVQQ